MNIVYIITVDTRHGLDVIVVKTQPTDADISLLEDYYLKAYDLEHVHVEYYMATPVDEIPESVTDYIAQQEK